MAEATEQESFTQCDKCGNPVSVPTVSIKALAQQVQAELLRQAKMNTRRGTWPR